MNETVRHTYEKKTSSRKNSDGEVVDKIKVKRGELPSKQFDARNSPLTDLWEVKHVRSVYHICVAVLISLFVNTAAHDILKDGKAKFGLNLFIKAFAKFHVFVLIWSCMFLTSIGIYFVFKFWAQIRVQLLQQSSNVKVWDKLWLGLYIAFYPLFMYFTPVAVIKCDLSIAMSMAVLMEMTRFIMKCHAFVRSNAPRVLKYKPYSGDQILVPEFSKFLYFSFAPTGVYQDKYPRSKYIRWNYVFLCILEFMGTLFLMSFLFERFFIPSFENYGKQPYTWKDIIILNLELGIPGFLILLCVFYLIFHSWMNAFAEILRFSDKMFYKDWWTSTNYERYYRTWNVVVHDWLYTYVYKDFYERITPKNKHAAKYLVFFISAFFHDYILGIAFRFCLPILFIQFFGAGTAISFFKIKQESIGNIFLWYTLALGTGMDFCFYAMEYYSRQNCPIENSDFGSYFLPQMFSCNKVHLNSTIINN